MSKGTLPDRTRELLTRFDHEDKVCAFCYGGDGARYAARLAGLLEEWLARAGERVR